MIFFSFTWRTNQQSHKTHSWSHSFLMTQHHLLFIWGRWEGQGHGVVGAGLNWEWVWSSKRGWCVHMYVCVADEDGLKKTKNKKREATSNHELSFCSSCSHEWKSAGRWQRQVKENEEPRPHQPPFSHHLYTVTLQMGGLSLYFNDEGQKLIHGLCIISLNIWFPLDKTRWHDWKFERMNNKTRGKTGLYNHVSSWSLSLTKINKKRN